MDIWNAATTYPNINCYINWIAMPIQHSVSREQFVANACSVEYNLYDDIGMHIKIMDKDNKGLILDVNDSHIGLYSTYKNKWIWVKQYSVSHDTKYAHLSWKAPYTNNKIQFDRIGDIVICHGNVKFDTSVTCNYSKASETLPVGFRPAEANVATIFSVSGHFAVFFSPDGTVTMLGDPENAYAPCTGSWHTKDDFPA